MMKLTLQTLTFFLCFFFRFEKEAKLILTHFMCDPECTKLLLLLLLNRCQRCNVHTLHFQKVSVILVILCYVYQKKFLNFIENALETSPNYGYGYGYGHVYGYG